jgi:hypothetical protein
MGESRRESRRLDAFDPETKGACKIEISFNRMQVVSRRGLVQASECAYIVPAVLAKPKAVFEGIRRDEDEDHYEGGVGWRCYCGIPAQSYRADGTPAAPYEDEVFLVFVNDQRVAYNWRWEKCDPDNPGLPIDHLARFTKRLP